MFVCLCDYNSVSINQSINNDNINKIDCESVCVCVYMCKRVDYIIFIMYVEREGEMYKKNEKLSVT